ncbi:MAG TPA: hypothetical protein VJB87_05745 [Candidatus Nanoarchaeia archaeon]|nr:hypothetical protein [Candidatus Nanoarchaeia archaeon]
MIIGFAFSTVSVERKNPLKGKVEVKYHLSIEDVLEESMPLAAGQMALRLPFKFSASYDPKIGSVELLGNVVYLTDDKTAKSLMDNWKKKKKLGDEKVAAVIFNNVLTRCNVRALSLAQEVGLPPHFPLPHVAPKDNVKEYIG